MAVSIYNQTGLLYTNNWGSFASVMQVNQCINDKNITLIDSKMSGNRLMQDCAGNITCLPKAPAEVAGEYLLRPLIDSCVSIANSFFQSRAYIMSQLKNVYTHMPSIPPFFPGVGAMRDECYENDCKEPFIEEVSPYQEVTTPHGLAETDLLFERIFESVDNVNDHPLKELAVMKNTRGVTLLQEAVLSESTEMVTRIVEVLRHTDAIRERDSQGRTLLHLAAIKDRSDLIPLLSSMIPINEEDFNGLTPLHWAIHEQNLKAVDAFIKQAASLSKPYKNEKGEVYSPIALAIVAGNSDILELFLQNDVLKQLNLEESVPNIGNVIHLAIQVNQAPMLDYLLKEKSPITQRLIEHGDPHGRTPLQLASYLGDLYAIQLLHTQGANLERDAGDKKGTAVHYAALGEKPMAIQLLASLGARLDVSDGNGNTPLSLVRNKTSSNAWACKALLEKLPRMRQTELTAPPNFGKRPPFNLVFKGGGPKGLAYVGAIRALEEMKALNEVKRIAGTSAGAITASLLATGYPSQELEPILSQDFTKFFDVKGELEDKLLKELKSKEISKSNLFMILLREYWGGWKTLIAPVERGKRLFNELNDQLYGLCKGEALRVWLEELIEKKTKKTHCTFEELHELVLKDPKQYKDLYVYATKLSKEGQSEIVRFSYEDPVWKKLIISDAIRASTSIPGLFEPYVLYFKDKERHPREDLGKFIDGGLIKNFPIDAFDSNRYQEDLYNTGEKTNRRTLGFSLQEDEQTSPDIDRIETAQDLSKAIYSTYLHAEEILYKEKEHNKERVVTIPIKGVGLMDFGVSEDKKKEMIEAGNKASSFFLKGKKKSLDDLD